LEFAFAVFFDTFKTRQNEVDKGMARFIGGLLGGVVQANAHYRSSGLGI
jgi:hypothetical protein